MERGGGLTTEGLQAVAWMSVPVHRDGETEREKKEREGKRQQKIAALRSSCGLFCCNLQL